MIQIIHFWNNKNFSTIHVVNSEKSDVIICIEDSHQINNLLNENSELRIKN